MRRELFVLRLRWRLRTHGGGGGGGGRPVEDDPPVIWFHERVLRHRIRQVKVFEAVWVHGGQRPKQVLINCSCGKSWVRR
jgi:hypothetical protein